MTKDDQIALLRDALEELFYISVKSLPHGVESISRLKNARAALAQPVPAAEPNRCRHGVWLGDDCIQCGEQNPVPAATMAPCVYCYSTNVKVELENDIWSATCGNCGRLGGYGKFKEVVIAYWNSIPAIHPQPLN